MSAYQSLDNTIVRLREGPALSIGPGLCVNVSVGERTWHFLCPPLVSSGPPPAHPPADGSSSLQCPKDVLTPRSCALHGLKQSRGLDDILGRIR